MHGRRLWQRQGARRVNPATRVRSTACFLGNGTGCSKTCTKEPKCRDGAAAATRACDVTLWQRQQGEWRRLRRRQPGQRRRMLVRLQDGNGIHLYRPAETRHRGLHRRGCRTVPALAGHLSRFQERERDGWPSRLLLSGHPRHAASQPSRAWPDRGSRPSASASDTAFPTPVDRCARMTPPTDAGISPSPPWTRTASRPSTPPAPTGRCVNASSPTGATTPTADACRGTPPPPTAPPPGWCTTRGQWAIRSTGGWRRS